jgi:hypothetical protein
MTDNCFLMPSTEPEALPEEKSRCKSKKRLRAIEGRLAFSGVPPWGAMFYLLMIISLFTKTVTIKELFALFQHPTEGLTELVAGSIRGYRECECQPEL